MRNMIGMFFGATAYLRRRRAPPGDWNTSNVINFKLSRIDGHIRLNSYLNEEMSTNNFSEIDSILKHASTSIKHTIIELFK